MKKAQVSQIAITLILIWMAVGCATIIHGSSQEIEVRSAPDNAEVWVDGAKMGTTPTRLTLKRSGDYTIKIVKEGFKEAEFKIEGKTSAWIIGNVIFGGIIGCIVDFASGGAYDLSPERLDINLTKMEALNGKIIQVDPDQLASIKEIRLLNADGSVDTKIDVTWID